MEEEKYNPFGSPGNKVGRGSSTERDRAERDSPAEKSSTSARAVGRRKRPKTDRIR
jgi:hypothetical protein